MKTITVIGRRWWNARLGHSYRNATVLVDGHSVGTTDIGDDCSSLAAELLEKLKLIPMRVRGGFPGAPKSLGSYCYDNKIHLESWEFDVMRKSDLKK